ncbi:MAG: ATP phosphoribosyltransferase regulatory subunit, partial [Chloroflexota bacterium]
MERCQGMRDLLPEEMSRFRHIENIFRQTCVKWGYEEIRTPVLEYLHLFTSAGTLSPDMLGRVYSFLDWDGWSGQRVVLRPDGTIHTARLYISQLQQPPARLCYVQNVFSFQASQRERWQCGVEFIGGTPPGADAELIRLSLEVLRGLGIEPELRLGHMGLVKALLRETGQDEEALHQILRRDLEPLIKARPELERPLSLLFELKGNSAGFLRNIQSLLLPQLPGIAPALTDFLALTELLT